MPETLVEARSIAQRAILGVCNHAEVYAVTRGEETPIEVWRREEIREPLNFVHTRVEPEPNEAKRVVDRADGRYIFEELPRSTGTYRMSQMDQT
jgi:hypothetical protein